MGEERKKKMGGVGRATLTGPRLWAAMLVGASAAVVGSALAFLGPEPSGSDRPPEPAQPAASARPDPLAWFDDYAAAEAEGDARGQLIVLEQVSARNVPSTWDDWVQVTVKSPRGTTASFEVSPHGLRLGTARRWVEVPLDGPHFAAAAELLGHEMANAWMVENTFREAKRSGRVVHYFAGPEIAEATGAEEWKPNHPDGEAMMSAPFIRERSLLLRRWLNDHGIEEDELVSGYFKAVVPPVDGVTRRGGLEIFGGYDAAGEVIQPLSGGVHGDTYFDYSHGMRLAKDVIVVDGTKMSMREFFGTRRYALDFGFQQTAIPRPAYPYPQQLAHWMEAKRR